MACTESHKDIVDKLNDKAYAYHYRSIDSSQAFAREAFFFSKEYHSGRAEALNNLAFVSISKMEYKLAKRQLDSVFDCTDNQLELLVADVQYMRLCQREAKNKDFYDYMERANRRMKRISEDSETLDERMQRRLVYAETEFSFVASTYFYYVGLDSQSKAALDKVNRDGLMQKDTAQYLNWLYQYGSGGMIKGKNRNSILQKEYDMLLECYLMAKKKGYRYWEANALQALSEHFIYSKDRERLISSNPVSIGYLNVDNMPDSLFAGYLAQRSMEIFRQFGDVYQTAGSIRTLAQCFWEIGDFRSSILWLQYIFNNLPQVRQAPDLVASIREQMSIVYSSMNEKYNSDVNRNIYLDMQERTRQDMELDARASQLGNTSSVLNIMIFIIVVLIVLFIILIVVLLRRESRKRINTDELLSALEECKQYNNTEENRLSDDIEELEEKRNLLCVDIEKNTWRNIDNRSKVFLVDSVTPLIDRMINEVRKLQERKEHDDTRNQRYVYITELSAKVDEYNDVLTHWIQLRQGEIGIKIETFSLSELFSMLEKSKTLFSMQGISLQVDATSLSVKADKILTLFMINTIADNARKFTPKGGTVQLSAKQIGEYVEISIKDNGVGMSEEQLSTVFNRSISCEHGFGLMNCRDILNKYRKVSKVFEGCDISAESTLGKGSRFWFRLPKGIVRLVMTLFIVSCGSMCCLPVNAQSKNTAEYKASNFHLVNAQAYADSAYASNVRGTYEQTLAFADSARNYLNSHYLGLGNKDGLLLRNIGDTGTDAPEILWYRRKVDTDYAAILKFRNEVAVAALALHRWDLYRYNNDVYTKLFKEVSADSSLAEYCRIMQRSEINKNIAIAILILLFIAIIIVGYAAYYRRAIKKHSMAELSREIRSILLSQDSSNEKLRRIRTLNRSRFFSFYSEIMNVIEQTLEKSSRKVDVMHASLQALKDDIGRMTYENNRLYVSNNILENCLSTIKHETMYYPSRIHHCISDNSLRDTHDTLQTVDDLLRYYKQLYSMLCEQLHRQLGNKIRCRSVNLSSSVSGKSISVLGDKILYDYLFLLLRRENKGVSPSCSMHTASEGYVILEVKMSNVSMTSDELVTLFLPHANHIPYMICRQIVREISDVTNMCACGITASASEGGTMILRFCLPCSND